jgi:hypothetical protein
MKSGYWLWRALLVGLLISMALVLTSCGLTEAVVDPVTQVVVEPAPLEQGLNAVIPEIVAEAPADPTNWTGWLYAVGSGLVAGGAVTWRAWVRKRRQPAVGSKINLANPSL